MTAGAIAALLGSMPTAQAAVTFAVTVTTTADADATDGDCSLREAIIAVNQGSAYRECTPVSADAINRIDFAIPGAAGDVHIIEVASRLPAITQQVLLDGLSQPGADCGVWPPSLKVVLHSAANGAFNGLTLDPGSDGSLVRGLVINGFNNNQGYAFNFNAAINIYRSNGNQIACNYLGTDAAGTSVVANLRGIDINSSDGNVIGSNGTLAYLNPADPQVTYHARNLISGNGYGQIDMRGDDPNDNVIAGNYLGTDASGSVALGGGAGVSINGNPTPAVGNVVGWDGTGDPQLMRNVISGFMGSANSGVEMVVGAQGNRVAGNYIGTDASGLAAVPNFVGVSLGSNASVFGNLIGNDGTQASAARNVISGNAFAGVMVNGANGTRDAYIVGNYIGVRADANGVLGNGSFGITSSFASATILVADNWIDGQPVAIRFFGSPGFGGGAVASFLNGVTLAVGGPVLHSRGNCVLGTTGVQITDQGATVPAQVFASNWWGAASGPNTSGASAADGRVSVSPWLTLPATVCSDVLFRHGFEVLPSG